MVENRWIGGFGALFVGLLMLVTAMPVKTSANANFWWDQITGQDFAGDTMTNVHVSNYHAGIYFVHLEDDESATYDFNYDNPATTYSIWDEVRNQLVGTFSQSFTPDIDGVVDKVDLGIWCSGTPKTPSDQDAKLIIRITDANQNGIYAPIMNSVKTEWYFTPSQVPSTPGFYTFNLTEYDSCYSTPLEAGTIYDLVVTSDAARDQTGGAGYFWKATTSQDTSNTDGCTKQYQGGQSSWVATGSPAFDFPFKVYVHNFVHSGDIVSSIHDCGGQVTFSETSIDHRDGGTLLFKVRTGPTSTPDGSWSDWVDQGYGSQNPGLDPNRYVQFTIEFTAGDDDLTTEGVDLVHIGWL